MDPNIRTLFDKQSSREHVIYQIKVKEWKFKSSQDVMLIISTTEPSSLFIEGKLNTTNNSAVSVDDDDSKYCKLLPKCELLSQQCNDANSSSVSSY